MGGLTKRVPQPAAARGGRRGLSERL